MSTFLNAKEGDYIEIDFVYGTQTFSPEQYIKETEGPFYKSENFYRVSYGPNGTVILTPVELETGE